MDDPETVDEQIRVMRHAVSGYRTAQIYITFAELEIGKALAEGPLHLTELARSCKANQQSLSRYIDAAVALGLLHRTADDLCELTNLSREAFTSGSNRSIANYFKLERAFYERWGRLTEAVRTGHRPPENRAQEDDPGWVRMFTLALFDNARQTAPAVAQAIKQSLPKPGTEPVRIIDIGGGHGAYSLAIARERSDIDATVFDLPPVIDVTTEIVSASDVAHQVRTVAGDFHEDDLGTGYDAALLFGVLHGETRENAARLIKRTYEALRPAGVLLIRSQGRPTSDPAPGEREIVDLHMLLSTAGGSVSRGEDTTDLVTRNGFKAGTPIEIPEPASGQLLVFHRGC